MMKGKIHEQGGMMERFRVQLEADFETSAETRQDVQKMLVNVITGNGFSKKNFEMTIEKCPREKRAGNRKEVKK